MHPVLHPVPAAWQQGLDQGQTRAGLLEKEAVGCGGQAQVLLEAQAQVSCLAWQLLLASPVLGPHLTAKTSVALQPA